MITYITIACLIYTSLIPLSTAEIYEPTAKYHYTPKSKRWRRTRQAIQVIQGISFGLLGYVWDTIYQRSQTWSNYDSRRRVRKRLAFARKSARKLNCDTDWKPRGRARGKSRVPNIIIKGLQLRGRTRPCEYRKFRYRLAANRR